jgi:hypothetical protein
MVVVSPNLECGPCDDHTFANLVSSSAPSTPLTHLPHDGLVKLCNDQSIFFHTTFEIPHKIMYIN